MNTGIYTITNKANGKMYVGSACVSFKKRKNHHWFHLRNKCHVNPHLQNAWNKHGEENFIFEVLEEVEPSLCLSLENYWCNLLNTLNSNYGYNVVPPLSTNLGRVLTQEIKNKISNTLKGRKVPREVVDKRVKTCLANNRKLTDYHKQQISNAQKNKIVSEETKFKMKASSPKTRPYIHKPVNQYNTKMEFIKYWSSIGQIVKELNISYTSISNNLKNRSKTAGGFIFKYEA